ncbi:MAG: radical SAM protein [Gammaproteobacteria bacterium]
MQVFEGGPSAPLQMAKPLGRGEKEMRLARIPPHDMALGPVEMVVLQGTAFCNLNCSYCYLSESSRRNKASMPIATIEATFQKLLSSRYVDKRCRVSWHSGEPMVLKPSYYREAINSILDIKTSRCGTDFVVDFDIQTNGTLIDQEWCDLINERDGDLLIGVSCDGPAPLHDRHRRNWADKPTHELTHAGMQRLCDNGIMFDVTAVVSPESLAQPLEFLEYFARFKDYIREFHFNLHDEFFIESASDGRVEAYAKRYDRFLRTLLDAIGKDKGNRFPTIRNFSAFYNRLFVDEHERPGYDARSMSKPFKTLSIEANGDVTTFYAGLTVDECRDLQDLYGDGKGLVIGNILDESLEEMACSPKLARIAASFEESHRACEAGCDYFDLCSGGYNLIKYRRFSTFDATQTPECYVHVQTFADTLLSELNSNVRA